MPNESSRGIAYGVSAYLIWGSFPLYFRLLRSSGPVEIVLHRVVWSLVVCAIVLTVAKGWPAVRAVMIEPRRLVVPSLAALVLALNWGTYVYGVNSGQVVETSLGYFINPLVTVLLGVVVLGERLRPLQWAAVAVGFLAVVVLTVDYGRPPWIALVLATSFGAYGLAKNRVGLKVGAVAGLTIETIALAPLAIAGLVWLQLTGGSTFSQDAPTHPLLLASVGVATVVPLLCFAAAARRVPLSTVGMLQYLAPVLQLLCGVLFLGETMTASRLLGFGIVWGALALLTVDSLRNAHRNRRPIQVGVPLPSNVPTR